jgi:hypothetical protein
MKHDSEKQKIKNDTKISYSKKETSTNHNSFSNNEIIIIAVYLLDGHKKYLDMEDIAIKVNEIAPGRFAWRKYPEQINLKKVEIRLCESRNPEKGGYILGTIKKGWMLSDKGLQYAKEHVKELKNTDLSRAPMNKKEMILHHREKKRMLASIAYEKVISNESDYITSKEAEDFFRVDDYVTGVARKEKLTRIINTYGDDPELSKAIKILSERVRKI